MFELLSPTGEERQALSPVDDMWQAVWEGGYPAIHHRGVPSLIEGLIPSSKGGNMSRLLGFHSIITGVDGRNRLLIRQTRGVSD